MLGGGGWQQCDAHPLVRSCPPIPPCWVVPPSFWGGCPSIKQSYKRKTLRCHVNYLLKSDWQNEGMIMNRISKKLYHVHPLIIFIWYCSLTTNAVHPAVQLYNCPNFHIFGCVLTMRKGLDPRQTMLHASNIHS